MSKALHRDPDRRCKPLQEWPDRDRALWQAALTPGDLFDDTGARAKHSEFSNRKVVSGYGRWLTFLDRQGLLDEMVAAADRITSARVKAYVADLEKHNVTLTLMNRLQELHAVAVVMDPDRDWSWIYRIHSQIRFRHRPARSKHMLVVSAEELFELGIRLMTSADQKTTASKAAMQFRDGLIIALLIARPTLRLRNLTALELGRTVVCDSGWWRIDIPAPETKPKRPIDQLWPEDLIEPLEAYLGRHRPVLLHMRRHSAKPPGEALWVSRHGSAMDRKTIYDCIKSRTRDGLGRAINPHLFRDCTTTTIAIEDPEHIGIASPLLGHLTPATTEKYYNQARGIEAVRRLQQVVLALRSKAAGSAADRP
jgi:hypothetical protein